MQYTDIQEQLHCCNSIFKICKEFKLLGLVVFYPGMVRYPYSYLQ